MNFGKKIGKVFSKCYKQSFCTIYHYYATDVDFPLKWLRFINHVWQVCLNTWKVYGKKWTHPLQGYTLSALTTNKCLCSTIYILISLKSHFAALSDLVAGAQIPK